MWGQSAGLNAASLALTSFAAFSRTQVFFQFFPSNSLSLRDAVIRPFRLLAFWKNAERKTPKNQFPDILANRTF